jgi:hypothetical protein
MEATCADYMVLTIMHVPLLVEARYGGPLAVRNGDGALAITAHKATNTQIG